jgi:hypothetical protein
MRRMATDPFLERRARTRFPIELPLRYEALQTNIQGIGITLDFSSHGLLISAARSKIPHRGSLIGVVVEWPVRLGGTTALQLIVKGKVVRHAPMSFAVLFERHEFRTMKRR